MPGGLLQLVAVGAQNELVNGSPSMTHFRSVYRRHTNFAMESIRMGFTASNLEFSATGTKTLSCRIDRYAQLLHDTYLVLTLPDIWSPLVPITVAPPTGYDARCTAVGYEFQWISNIGYNLIDHVDITMNGQAIQTLTGEWLKLYSYMTHDTAKREIVDNMVGNLPELYDPANAYDRNNQYPHALTPKVLPGTSPNTLSPEPSIRSRQLVIPLHFWFCENPGMALPLVSLQNSEVFINVTMRALTDLYTVVDVEPTSLTFGNRIRPVNYPMQLFLSPPLSTGLPSNTTLTTWFPDPFVEGNFVYLTEMEMNQLAKADQTFLVKTVKYVMKDGQFGGNTDLEIPMFNLVTRIVFLTQRSDQILLNKWDNYTNWANPKRAPWSAINSDVDTSLFSSGQQQVSSAYPRDSVIDGVILFDGKERIQTKPLPFFSLQQMYRHLTGITPELPGVYMYSFALDHNNYQPSGAVNGSMFNKIILRLTLLQPLPQSVLHGGGTTSTMVCVLTSSLYSLRPVIIPAANVNLTDPKTGKKLYPPGTITTVVQTNDNVIFTFTYNVGVYVESINFLRIVSGLGNLVFAS
jgi:hypothetical protein